MPPRPSSPRSSLPPSTVVLPSGAWATVFDCLCAQFPAISAERWRDRFERGRVLDAGQRPLPIAQPYRVGLRIHYFREVADEKPIPFREAIVHADAHLIVADKPHFLPVTPVGEYVEETLLARLIARFDNPDIVPLHRIDRHTAGLVLFSAQRDTRAAYQALFRERQIEKRYEAIAPPLHGVELPLTRRSRIVRGEPFFLSREVAGEPNAQTRIDVIERGDTEWRYALHPVTGKKHQLRLHMAALGAPICNDMFYPHVRAAGVDDYTAPLQLLAQALCFRDPLDRRERHFLSGLTLMSSVT